MTAGIEIPNSFRNIRVAASVPVDVC